MFSENVFNNHRGADRAEKERKRVSGVFWIKDFLRNWFLEPFIYITLLSFFCAALFVLKNFFPKSISGTHLRLLV